MDTMHRRIATFVIAIVALPVFSILVSASAADRSNPEGLFVSGIPGPLFAALAGMPAESMGWGGLAHISLAQGSETLALVSPGPMLYAVKTGQVAIRSDGAVRVVSADMTTAQELTLRGDEFLLGPDDQILIAAGVSHAIRVIGLDEAVLLATTILPSSVVVPTGFINDGLTPVRPLGVALFLGIDAGVGDQATWPNGVTVTTHTAAKIVAESP